MTSSRPEFDDFPVGASFHEQGIAPLMNNATRSIHSLAVRAKLVILNLPSTGAVEAGTCIDEEVSVRLVVKLPTASVSKINREALVGHSPSKAITGDRGGVGRKIGCGSCHHGRGGRHGGCCDGLLGRFDWRFRRRADRKSFGIAERVDRCVPRVLLAPLLGASSSGDEHIGSLESAV